MSAVPKKKLCWQCEGYVAREIDNCPYCGVYLQETVVEKIEDNPLWKSPYHPSSTHEGEIPSPIYKLTPEPEIDDESQDNSATERPENPLDWKHLFDQLKQDVLPILFLMMGSIFLLFGIVLYLFSQNGTLTLQWQEKYGLYFLLFAFPLIGFGWKFLQQIKENNSA